MTGGVIALVAPSGPFDPAEMAAGVALAGACGRPVRWFAEDCEADGFLAAPDLRRARHLHAAFCDPSVDLVWALRGGYGALRLLPHLDLARLAANPKPLLGLSDVSLLLNALAARAGVPAVHGPVARQVPRLDAASREALTAFFASGGLPRSLPVRPLAGDAVEGRLWGGNLATLCSAVGTPWFPNLEDALLVVEDVNEAPYRVDRMFQTLAQSGALRGVRGVVLGEFSDADAPAALRLDLLIELANRHGFALAHGLACGHGAANLPWRLGALARLNAAEGMLEVAP